MNKKKLKITIAAIACFILTASVVGFSIYRNFHKTNNSTTATKSAQEKSNDIIKEQNKEILQKQLEVTTTREYKQFKNAQELQEYHKQANTLFDSDENAVKKELTDYLQLATQNNVAYLAKFYTPTVRYSLIGENKLPFCAEQNTAKFIIEDIQITKLDTKDYKANYVLHVYDVASKKWYKVQKEDTFKMTKMYENIYIDDIISTKVLSTQVRVNQ